MGLLLAKWMPALRPLVAPIARHLLWSLIVFPSLVLLAVVMGSPGDLEFAVALFITGCWSILFLFGLVPAIGLQISAGAERHPYVRERRTSLFSTALRYGLNAALLLLVGGAFTYNALESAANLGTLLLSGGEGSARSLTPRPIDYALIGHGARILCSLTAAPLTVLVLTEWALAKRGRHNTG